MDKAKLDKIKKMLNGKASWVILVFLVLMFSILTPNFRTYKNFLTILRQSSVNGIGGVGLAIILISGGIDLSTGSQAAFVGMICSMFISMAGWSLLPAVVVSILIDAIVFGGLNGMAISRTNMPPLIATLGTSNIARGACYLVNNGFIVYGLSNSAKFIAQGDVLGVPFCVILLIITLCIGNFILNKTTYGRLIFAVGANKEAARLTGINDKAIKCSAYIVGGAFIAFAGVVLMSRINSGMPSAGTDIYIEILAGCMIGGISSHGGSGNVFTMMGGVFCMTVLSNGMNILGLSDYWQYVFKGFVLIITVGVDSYRNMQIHEKKSHVIRTSEAAKQAASKAN